MEPTMQDFESQARAQAAQIEQELEEGHLNFPTAMEISLRVKELADDPNSSVDDIAAVVSTEPVLSAKVVRMANAMLLNPYGARITSVNGAVKRIGLAALRCLAFAVAAEQLAQDHRSPQLRKIATDLWRHSADIASWGYAFAYHLRTVNPDTAMLTGMMIGIGQFFLLARVSDYPALESNIERVFEFVSVWEDPISRSVLEAFELPNDIIDALGGETFCEDGWPPQTLRDVVQAAIRATSVPNPLGHESLSRQRDNGDVGYDPQQFAALLDAARIGKDAMLNAIYG
jgi:HD-like signal output (HDOD) protein